MLLKGVLSCLCCWISLFQLTSALPTTQHSVKRRRDVKKLSVTTECGSAPKLPSVERRVINGEPAEFGDWPWMAALIDKKQGQFCGGTLVKDQFILTAAHCVKGREPEDIIITLGVINWKKPNKEAVNYTVKSIIYHPEYVKQILNNDIAILKLNENVQLTPQIHSACLPSKALSPQEKFAYVTGWGQQNATAPTSSVLLEVNFTIWRQDDCSRTLKKIVPEFELPDSQLCAGTQDGSKDSCRGDSGGPLVIKIDGKWIISGVVSGGLTSCGAPNSPGIYTKVSSYNSWIKEVIYSHIRIGCPDGFKNFDEFTCINEYYLDQFKKGALTWETLLERRQKIERLLPTRTSNQKCPGGNVEFDEFNCLTTFLFERYQSKKENWNGLINFLKNKAVLASPASDKIVSGRSEPPSVTPPKFPLDTFRQQLSRVSCDTTSAAKQGLAQIKFDEVYCVSPEYINGFKSGEFDWYAVLSKRFEKKL